MSDAKGLTFGRYVLLERLAAGGMGEVYVGLQTGIGEFQRPVAVKLLLPHLSEDEGVVRMFLQEARVGAQITHANVAQVYDVGVEHGRYFIAMELVRGVSLSRLIRGLQLAREHLPARLVSYIGWALCEGLHAAHEQKGPDGRALGIVHRDVTPHNILVSVDGAVKLSDFGIARVADASRLTAPGVVLGKLGYLAPEQILGKPIDRRVDVFAAGATLYHLAALTRPFDTQTGETLNPERVPETPLRVLRPDAPLELVGAIEAAMQPDAQLRLQTARELRDALPAPKLHDAEALGELVARVCAADVAELELKLEHARSSKLADTQPDRPSVQRRAPSMPERGGTISLPERATPAPVPAPARPPVEPSVSSVSLAPPRRSLAPVLVIAAMLLLGGGGAYLALSTRGQVAEPRPPATIPVTQVPVAPPEKPVEPDPTPPPPPVRPPEPAAEDKTPGVLSIDATPWAEVTLDGKRIGETPLANVRASPGPHTLVLKNPDNGKVVKKQLTVVAGKSQAVRADLR